MLGFGSFCELPFSSVEDEGQTGITPFYFSDRAYWTKPTDILPTQQFLPRVMNPGFIERSIPISPLAARRVSISIGQIELDNSDGYLDTMVDRYAIDGRRVVIKTLSPTTAYGNAIVLFDGTATGWAAFEDVVTISVRDELYKLDVPLMAFTYSGAGGLDGTVELAGKPYPLCFGRCLNVPLVLVDPTNLIYQASWRAIQAVDAIYDSGLALTPAGDVADITATAVNPGEFKTQLSGGYIRLGGTPAGLVTADLQGDAGDSGYVDDTGSIVYRIMNTFAGIGVSDLDGGSFLSLTAAQPAEVGFFFPPTPIAASDAIDIFLAGIGGYVAPTRTGLIQVGRFDAPTSSASIRVDKRHIHDIVRLQLPPEIEPAIYSVSVGYQPIFAQQISDLAGAVTAERRQFLAQALRTATVASIGIQTKHLLARGLVNIPGLFYNEADASAEADRLLDIWAASRRLYAVRLKGIGYLLNIHGLLEVAYERWGMDAGVTTRIVGIKEDYSRDETIVTVFR
jgi:hypothetical protein